ncbi:HEPN domain-containing protein [Archaeoglobus fulgidus]|jgi:HEPN domain-containing protein|uniref:HEPN domain-containing protein n=2 Tax=Archaeoglobus fulgidus TaxID=2234 RepID=A0A075WMM8_ARCFL|nr:HEPN domain-containing protein [Archaeoglobus fulgidus]AIG98813.1 hypothetical protein AFULGI_00020650 [Archaeoglobus fulgidus DSM 8774]KUJ92540.1 MAG: hypothetical protein XD40_2268 [Archaeoglobus fulgidus]KUK05416.1 MAG: hypothetical protein XD48_2354 [Archaeoglobus fulgidus]MDI3496743.1 hypothetical protein [Archaeoglobus sp.]
MEFLKQRALRFYSKANFTMFFAEQAVQLGLKFIIAKKYGEILLTLNTLKK